MNLISSVVVNNPFIVYFHSSVNSISQNPLLTHLLERTLCHMCLGLCCNLHCLGEVVYRVARPGHSGYPKISGRVFRVLQISGFKNSSPKFAQNKQNPTFRVPDISGSGSGLPNQPEMQLRRQPATDPLNK